MNHINYVLTGLLIQEAFVSSDEFGSDLEHVEVLQRKFDEFQKDMAAQEFRVTEVLELADRLVADGHPEEETIIRRKEVCVYFFFPPLTYLLLSPGNLLSLWLIWLSLYQVSVFMNFDCNFYLLISVKFDSNGWNDRLIPIL